MCTMKLFDIIFSSHFPLLPYSLIPEASLTKKELEDTMRTMRAPPGAGGFGGPDGESALDRFTRDLTMVARQVWMCGFCIWCG